MSRIGLQRHARLDGDAGDPLDGLVNLFDIGIVLAVAFLIAGMSLTRDPDSGRVVPRAAAGSAAGSAASQDGTTREVHAPDSAARARGRGAAVGTVYRLGDGRLVLVTPGGGRQRLAPDTGADTDTDTGADAAPAGGAR